MSHLTPNWDAPSNISAITTTRGNFGLNTSINSPAEVQKMRHELRRDLGLPHPPTWLKQVHGDAIFHIQRAPNGEEPIADASYCTTPGLACAILTADCLPILLTNREGSFVAALHCGWRGLHQNLIQKALSLTPSTSEILAWIGPGISQENYIVDHAFYARFCDKDKRFITAFEKRKDKYLANLPQIAEQQLQSAGVHAISHSGLCSHNKSDKLHSFRRDGKASGRMATLIWINHVYF